MSNSSVWKKLIRSGISACLLFLVPTEILATQEQTLAVNVSLKRKNICKVDPEIGLIRLTLNIGYQNLAKTPIVLFKESNEVVSAFSAGSLEEFTKGAFTRRYPALIVSGRGEPLKDEDFGKFVILKPRSTHRVNVKLDLPIALRGAGESAKASALLSGTHAIGFTVKAWPQTSSKIVDVATNWKHLGVLWSDDIRVGPITLAIPSVLNPKTCGQ